MYISIHSLKEYPNVVHELISLLYSEWHNDFELFGIASLDEMYLNINRDCLNFEHTLIAIDEESNDNLLGFVTIVDTDMGIKRENNKFIGHLYVKTQYRGVGLGKLLMTSCMSYAKSTLNLDRIYLWTYTQPLRDWYENVFNFKNVDVVLDYLSYDTIYVMCKTFF